LAQLTKARLSFLVLITTFVGFCMGSADKLDWLKLLHTLLGTGLVTGAAAILNQVIEINVDRLMERTRHRPLPAGRMTRSVALRLGIGSAIVGLLYLALATTFLATYLAAATLVIYLAFYTPMKRRNALCVTIGAVSGAIPPVIGWAAVNGKVGIGAWVLFGVLFAWQMPHFLAIAWMYRDEYAQAGFAMLPRRDSNGSLTAIQSLLFSIGLSAVTLVPVFLHTAHWVYLGGALVCDVILIACAINFLTQRNRPAARRLFFASILYLPALLGLMVCTKGW
jgi:protoheme IX farnesyltransferase